MLWGTNQGHQDYADAERSDAAARVRGVQAEVLDHRDGPRRGGVCVTLRYTVADNGCWMFDGVLNSSGYGTVTVDGRRCMAHRVSYEEEHGPIGAGLALDHRCRERRCVNPEHLEPVTPSENLFRRPGSTRRAKVCGHPATAKIAGGGCRMCA